MMRRRTILLLSVTLFACVEADPGPDAPIESVLRPRAPEHFFDGNGTDLPTPFADVRSQALASGIVGMDDYTLADWVRPRGSLRTEERDGQTVFTVSLDGLIPNGLYTMWLVRPLGTGRGGRTAIPLSRGFAGDARPLRESNQVMPDEAGHYETTVRLDPEFTDPLARRYFSIYDWDEIHLAFHADDRGYGFAPGPSHWVQGMFSLHPDEDGTHQLALSADTSDLEAHGIMVSDVMALAERAGVDGASDYDELAWGAARAAFTAVPLDLGTTSQLTTMVTAEGLVPGGTYSTWLRAADGHRCALGQLTDDSQGSVGIWSAQIVVDAEGRGHARARLQAGTACGERTFESLEGWAFVDVVFHPNGGDTYRQLSVALP